MPVRFAVIGSGWRAMYYARIAKALPQEFTLCAMLCRTPEKAVSIAEKAGIRTVTSVKECIDTKPDFVVIAVDKLHIAEVSMEWLERGFAVLAETPAAMDRDTLERLRVAEENGLPLVFAEQYRLYPEMIAKLALLEMGLIGEPEILYLSAAHEYHAASLMRAFLQVAPDTKVSVAARQWELPIARTMTRYEKFTDGQMGTAAHTAAIFSFSDHKACIYDFTSEQYRSPIRSCGLRLRGSRGEITDQTVRWLDENNTAQEASILVESREVRTEDPNPNFSSFREITGISFCGKTLYTPPLSLAGLSQDDTAIAQMLRKMGAYARGEGAAPYPLAEALQDAYMGILLREAAVRNYSEIM